MPKILIICLPLIALFVMKQIKETSIHDSIGQTISFKADLTVLKHEKKNYEIIVSVEDAAGISECVVKSKELSQLLKQSTALNQSFSITGLRLWNGRDAVGYHVEEINSERSVVFQIKSCKKSYLAMR